MASAVTPFYQDLTISSGLPVEALEIGTLHYSLVACSRHEEKTPRNGTDSNRTCALAMPALVVAGLTAIK